MQMAKREEMSHLREVALHSRFVQHLEVDPVIVGRRPESRLVCDLHVQSLVGECRHVNPPQVLGPTHPRLNYPIYLSHQVLVSTPTLCIPHCMGSPSARRSLC